MTIPNMITVARLLAVPVFAWALLEGRLQVAFFIFLAAGLSDAIDGYLARRWNQHSEFGAWLDPIADKLLMASAYGLLGFLGFLPAWLVLLVVGRDVLIVVAVGVARLQGKALEIKPILVSKANTAAQVFLVVLVLADLAFAFAADDVVWAVIVATATLTILSGAAYFNIWMRLMRGVTAT
ncbi:cardiolipin synthase [Mycoplana sp. BE70]|uniref:CDP-alcohol phosphatidyltransferase family protein n=1 Tax=Mycoplana sp. BE70 TaxID=2817775 RepID=UPI00285B817A|nr:CDP-alcohol phosphatidyltransferase family protein [Mycoplana sp. BE70]MDR6757413.1 cardiolipin synthase [Mycoplana sp. BE70]